GSGGATGRVLPPAPAALGRDTHTQPFRRTGVPPLLQGVAARGPAPGLVAVRGRVPGRPAHRLSLRLRIPGLSADLQNHFRRRSRRPFPGGSPAQVHARGRHATPAARVRFHRRRGALQIPLQQRPPLGAPPDSLQVAARLLDPPRRAAGQGGGPVPGGTPRRRPARAHRPAAMNARLAPPAHVSMAISPLEYARFLRAIGRDRRLPLSWQEWSVQARHADGFIVSMGGRVESVPVEYEGFMRYCADRGERPSYPALRAYA